MDHYEVTLTGISPLLLHNDNIDFADQLTAYRQLPANKASGVAGDDRSPAFSWLGCLYEYGGLVVMSADNIMKSIMEGGSSVTIKGSKTFKAQTQSGMLVVEPGWPIVVDGHTIDATELFALRTELSFTAHRQAATDRGFSLFTKRATIGTKKHVRVRPRFDRWEINGHINVWDNQISKDVLTSILTYAGEYKGLGDWRPSSKTPGPFGRFSAAVKLI